MFGIRHDRASKLSGGILQRVGDAGHGQKWPSAGMRFGSMGRSKGATFTNGGKCRPPAKSEKIP